MYLHAQSQSPDPLYAREAARCEGNRSVADIYPNAVVRAFPVRPAAERWAKRLSLFSAPPALDLKLTKGTLWEIVLDMGVEIEAEFEIECIVSHPCNICAVFGESRLEVEGLGLPTIVPDVPLPVEQRYLDRAGHHLLTCEARGFRFVRIAVPDAPERLKVTRIAARAFFGGQARLGDFMCSDWLFQRVWQASLYTARLCTRANSFWDGIKRDRVGWYGDARITQQAVDTAFDIREPAFEMLLELPTDRWANNIPTYSFDAIAMFRQLLLRYGLVRGADDIYRRIAEMLAWTKRTHTNASGLFVRNSACQYFFGIGFIDWSPMPVGGRFEELAWLQMRYLEALRMAAEVAGWIGKRADAARYAAEAEQLSRVLKRRFYRPRVGFIHTLNRSQVEWDKLGPDNHYRSTYIDKVRLGASGPSRHSSALAVWAGLCTGGEERRSVLRTLDNDRAAPVITPYFAYYEQVARAECGDVLGALMHMREYVGTQLVDNDSPTVWESYEPEVTDFRRWSLGRWPKSLCHGWGSGIVPVTTYYMVGIRPQSPGHGHIMLRPAPDTPWRFQATVPTPHGCIKAVRESKSGPVRFTVPREIQIVGPHESHVEVVRS